MHAGCSAGGAALSEMVERVSDALFGSDDIVALTIKEANGLAERAIEAMRDPTDGMTTAGAAQPITGPISAIWRAMIDESLK